MGEDTQKSNTSGNTTTGASPTRVLLTSGNSWFFRPTLFQKPSKDKLKVLKGTQGLSAKLPKLDQCMVTAPNIVVTVIKLAKLVPQKNSLLTEVDMAVVDLVIWTNKNKVFFRFQICSF